MRRRRWPLPPVAVDPAWEADHIAAIEQHARMVRPDLEAMDALPASLRALIHQGRIRSASAAYMLLRRYGEAGAVRLFHRDGHSAATPPR